MNPYAIGISLILWVLIILFISWVASTFGVIPTIIACVAGILALIIYLGSSREERN